MTAAKSASILEPRLSAADKAHRRKNRRRSNRRSEVAATLNTGQGDAINLAWKLAAVLQEHASPKILDIYEPERIALGSF